MVAESEVVIDRWSGQAHPRFPDVVYPVDYGHLEDSRSGDGAEVDVFVGSARGAGVVGVLLTADPGKWDVELKVLLDCTAAEVEQARGFCSEVLGIGGHLVERDGSG
ncbi:inorganic pyrophosphatase [Saccharopolyspora antimicrobica]|uniref:inorganic pyrophosphatase n=1 Tax=Saccharopolyspora antimicrobica TaxID=455193 RepID=UPI001FE47892|nr:inorganic pyrophosphatase [Saccharopolyspora antimicrobica]